MNFKIFVFFKFSKIQCHIVKVYVEIIFLRRQIFRFCTALYGGVSPLQWQWRHVLVTVECFCDCEEVLL